MRKAFLLAVAFGFVATGAMAEDLQLTVKSGGSSSVVVGTGDPVSYTVEAVLVDTANRGLALIGFDLQLVEAATQAQAGSLAQAATPAGMTNFAVPEGLNNPAGYGGTDDSGKLLQIGGAQNTINNTVDCDSDDDCPGESNLCIENECTASAPFPIGTVIENIGHTSVTVATGNLNAPMTEGDYVLKLSDAFANVIAADQSGSDLYWKTLSVDPADIAITSLAITVRDTPTCPVGTMTWVNPVSNTVDARQPCKIDNAGVLQGISTVTATGPAGAPASCWSLCETKAEGADNGIAGVVENTPGNYTITLNRRITPGAVTKVIYTPTSGTASKGRFVFLPADSNADGVSNTVDILGLIDCCLNAVCTPPYGTYSCDIDQSLVVNSADILRLIDLLNGAGAFSQAWNLKSVYDGGECP